MRAIITDNNTPTPASADEDLLGDLSSSELLKHLLSEARKCSVPGTNDDDNDCTESAKSVLGSSWWMNHGFCADRPNDGLLDSVLDSAERCWWTTENGGKESVETRLPTDGGPKRFGDEKVMDGTGDSSSVDSFVIRDLDGGDKDGDGVGCEEDGEEDVDSAMVLVPTGECKAKDKKSLGNNKKKLIQREERRYF